MKNFRNVLMFILFAFSVISCSSEAENTVKKGSFKACGTYKVGDLIDSYVEDSKWESIVATDNNTYVNVKGKILQYSMPSTIQIQFRVEGESFEINSIEVNGKEQNMFYMAALVNNMCDNLSNSK
jgi:hypothetical protein